MIAAKGGLERLRGDQEHHRARRARRALGPNAPSDTAETSTYLEYPNHVRVESTIRGTDVVQVFDGTRAWVKDPSGIHDVPERMVRDLQNALAARHDRVLLAAADGRVRVRRLPDVKDETGAVRHALEFSGDRSRSDGHVRRCRRPVSWRSRPTSPAAWGSRWSRRASATTATVDGVQIAFAASVRVGGEPVLERRSST